MHYQHVSIKRLIYEELILLLIFILLMLFFSLIFHVDSIMYLVASISIFIVLLLIGIIYLPALWKNAGWRLSKNKNTLYIRNGYFFLKQSTIHLDKITNISLFKTPLSPILKTATIVVRTAGNSCKIRGISLNNASTLLDDVLNYKSLLVGDSNEF